MTNIAVAATTCYYCDNIEATDGWGEQDCQGFNETAMTENCGADTHCISGYGKAADKEIEIHGCTYPDDFVGG